MPFSYAVSRKEAKPACQQIGNKATKVVFLSALLTWRLCLKKLELVN